MNGCRWLSMLLLFVSALGRGTMNDDSTRAAGMSLAERIVAEASLERGQIMWVTWSGDVPVERDFADGLVAGFLSWGLIVKADRPAETRHVFSLDIAKVDREDGRVMYAVRLVSGETNSFVLVKEFGPQSEDDGFFDRWGVPLILAGAASLIVYLLLTVRSS